MNKYYVSYLLIVLFTGSLNTLKAQVDISDMVTITDQLNSNDHITVLNDNNFNTGIKLSFDYDYLFIKCPLEFTIATCEIYYDNNISGFIEDAGPHYYFEEFKNTRGSVSFPIGTSLEYINLYFYGEFDITEIVVYAYAPTLPTYINSIQEFTALRPGLTALSTVTDKKEVMLYTSYFDGLGKLVQQVKKQQSAGPLDTDIIKSFEYDGLGRLETEYLPYSSGQTTGTFNPKAVGIGQEFAFSYEESEQYQFYQNQLLVSHSTHPYSINKFENNQLNRLIELGAPGSIWQPGTGNTIRYTHEINLIDDQVFIWNVDFISEELSTNGYYGTGQLYKIITVDEQGHRTIEFVDRLGRHLLKRVQANEAATAWADTYYVYEDFGDLRYVLPPEAVRAIGNPGTFPHRPSPTVLSQWTFGYDYDGRRRLIKKKVPGADTLYMVYDNRDRLVLTQDGEQRKQDEWLFTKYDAFNRPVLTGFYETSSTLSQEAMQLAADTYYSGPSVPFYETLGGNVHGYTNVTFPSQSGESRYLSVTYYDDYSFQGTVAGFNSSFHYQKPVTSGGCQTIPQGTYCYEDEAFDRVKGQVTGAKVKILGTDQWINTVTHYDDRYRVIQTVSTNTYLGVTTRTSQLYNFPGWLLETYKSQTRGSKTLGLRQRYSYDHAGRLLRGYHELYDDGVGQGEVLLAENRYNELGELIEKNLHVEGGVPAQSIDYRYNIRGWLESINNAQLTHDPRNDDSSDLFGMELIYESPLNGVPPVGN